MLPRVSKVEAASNRIRRIKIICSTRIQSKNKSETIDAVADINRNEFKYIWSHSIVQSNGEIITVSTQQLVFCEPDDPLWIHLNDDLYVNLKGVYFDAGASTNRSDYTFEHLVSDVVMNSNQDVSNHQDDNLSLDPFDIVESITVISSRHKNIFFDLWKSFHRLHKCTIL